MNSDVIGLKASKKVYFCLVHPQNIISLVAHQDDFWQIHLYNNFKKEVTVVEDFTIKWTYSATN